MLAQVSQVVSALDRLKEQIGHLLWEDWHGRFKGVYPTTIRVLVVRGAGVTVRCGMHGCWLVVADC